MRRLRQRRGFDAEPGEDIADVRGGGSTADEQCLGDRGQAPDLGRDLLAPHPVSCVPFLGMAVRTYLLSSCSFGACQGGCLRARRAHMVLNRGCHEGKVGAQENVPIHPIDKQATVL